MRKENYILGTLTISLSVCDLETGGQRFHTRNGPVAYGDCLSKHV